MIYFITKAEKTYTLLSYINTWGKGLRKWKKFLPAEKMVRQKKLYAGTYILTDVDLFNEKQKLMLATIYKMFDKHRDSFSILNHPTSSVNRLDLLKKMNDYGINSFRCFSANHIPGDIRFPVFIRKGIDHGGKITGLINHQEILGQEINECKKLGYPTENIIITEFVNTADKNGIYRKYSAFRIGDNIIPRHIFFSKNWMIKSAMLDEDEFIKEELNFLKSNPHKTALKEVFDLAGITYGRIDYGIVKGKIVVWEINTNPMIASSSSLKKPARKPAHTWFAAQFTWAFKKLETNKNSSAFRNPLAVSVSKPELKKLFPFNPVKYFFSNLYQTIKPIILYNFYSIRNKYLR